MLGEYNHSVLCYEQALQAQPGFEQALRRKHAVLCQQKLEQRLEAQHRWEFVRERDSFLSRGPASVCFSLTESFGDQSHQLNRTISHFWYSHILLVTLKFVLSKGIMFYVDI